jgi:putative Ca2+/H+ antiporter (TMEM165/GDT1 family)
VVHGWLEVAAIAFGAQLAVLPGEKVQLIIAGLATRYDPLVVVAAAGSAFAGWTALEVVVGRQLQRAVPAVYLDVVTGALFLLFTALLVHSAPSRDHEGAPGDAAVDRAETDGGPVPVATDAEGRLEVTLPLVGRIPAVGGNFLPIFALMAAGEFGDKTQMVTFGLAVQYARPSAIWAGEMAAIIPVSLANAYLFHRFSHRFDLRLAHLVGAALFAFFGVDTLQSVVTGTSYFDLAVEHVARVLLALI